MLTLVSCCSRRLLFPRYSTTIAPKIVSQFFTYVSVKSLLYQLLVIATFIKIQQGDVIC